MAFSRRAKFALSIAYSFTLVAAFTAMMIAAYFHSYYVDQTKLVTTLSHIKDTTPRSDLEIAADTFFKHNPYTFSLVITSGNTLLLQKKNPNITLRHDYVDNLLRHVPLSIETPKKSDQVYGVAYMEPKSYMLYLLSSYQLFFITLIIAVTFIFIIGYAGLKQLTQQNYEPVNDLKGTGDENDNHRFLDQSPIPVFWINTKGVFCYTNHAFLSTIVSDAGSIQGNTIENLFHDKEKAEIRKCIKLWNSLRLEHVELIHQKAKQYLLAIEPVMPNGVLKGFTGALVEEKVEKNHLDFIPSSLGQDDTYLIALKETNSMVFEYSIKDKNLLLHSNFFAVTGYPNTKRKADIDFWMEKIFFEDRQIMQDAFGQITANLTDTIRCEARFRKADGMHLWLRIVGKRSSDRDSVTGVIIDISDQKEKDNTIHNLSIVLDSTSDAIIYLNKALEIKSLNKAAFRMLNKPKKEIIGAKVTNYLFSPNQSLQQLLEKNFAGDFMRKEEITIQNDLQEDKILSVSCYPVYDITGTATTVASTAADVTIAKKSHKALAKMVFALTKVLSIPLTVISENISSLDDGCCGELDAEQKAFIKSSRAHIRKIHQIVREAVNNCKDLLP